MISNCILLLFHFFGLKRSSSLSSPKSDALQQHNSIATNECQKLYPHGNPCHLVPNVPEKSPVWYCIYSFWDHGICISMSGDGSHRLTTCLFRTQNSATCSWWWWWHLIVSWCSHRSTWRNSHGSSEPRCCTLSLSCCSLRRNLKRPKSPGPSGSIFVWQDPGAWWPSPSRCCWLQTLIKG